MIRVVYVVIRFIQSAVILAALLATTMAHAATISPMVAVEKQIAARQGQFGALYAQCGTFDEKAIIGGSLTTWRDETFRGYKGTAEERAIIEKAFDDAAGNVKADPASCNEWIKKASAAWKDTVQLVEHGSLQQAASANP